MSDLCAIQMEIIIRGLNVININSNKLQQFLDLKLARLLCPWGFSNQEYWSRLPFPSPGDLPDQGIEPTSPTLADIFLTTAPPGKPLNTRIQSLRKPPIETQNFRSKY